MYRHNANNRPTSFIKRSTREECNDDSYRTRSIHERLYSRWFAQNLKPQVNIMPFHENFMLSFAFERSRIVASHQTLY